MLWLTLLILVSMLVTTILEVVQYGELTSLLVLQTLMKTVTELTLLVLLLEPLYGIAKKATAVAVKVLDRNGSGTLAGVINGLNWVGEQRKAHQRPSTANLSLGASYSAIVNDATDAIVRLGVFTAVAAGNSNANTCNYSPASAALACSVGATSSSDIRAYFSNWGVCTDVMAPGVDILSAWIGSATASLTISGTSMAAPHVAGVGTALLSFYNDLTPLEVEEWIVTHASKVNLGDLRGSPDLLLYKGCETKSV